MNIDKSNLEGGLGKASLHAVNQYIQLAQEQNLDIHTILTELGISTDLLNDGRQYITGYQFQALIKALLQLSNDELFGLHTAKFVQPGSYSVLGYISMNCKTLGEVISKIKPFEQLVGDMGSTYVEQQGDSFKISWQCHFTDFTVRQQIVDNCLASWLTFARYLVSDQGNATKVVLSRTTPKLQHQQQYQEVFGCPVQYNQNENAIIFDVSLLDLPLNKGDQYLLSALESHAKTLLTDLSAKNSVVNQVKREIEKGLKSGKYRQQNIASLLGVSAKTLQRRLSEENYTYQKLLDEVRLIMAKDFLKLERLSIDEISTHLGFLEQRSFFRWFKKMTCLTPSKYRLNN